MIETEKKTACLLVGVELADTENFNLSMEKLQSSQDGRAYSCL